MDAGRPSPARTPFGFGALALDAAPAPVTQRLATLARIHADSSGRVAVAGSLAMALWSRDAELAAVAVEEPVELLADTRVGVRGGEGLGDASIESVALGDSSLFYAARLTDDWDEFVVTTRRLETVRTVRRHALDRLDQLVDVTVGSAGPFRLRLLRPAGLALAGIARAAEAPSFMWATEWAAAADLLISLVERQRHAMFSDVWTMQHAFLTTDRPDVQAERRQGAVDLVIEFLDGGRDEEAIAALRARCDRGSLPYHPARIGPAVTWLEQAALALSPELA